MFYLNKPGSLTSCAGVYICGHGQYRPPTHSSASQSCFFVPQGLFPPADFISSLLFCSTGIISAGRFHPYLALLLHRDYFRRPVSSLSCSSAPQGLFPPADFILILLFCSTGIISTSRMHLYLAFLFHRDYFGWPISSQR